MEDKVKSSFEYHRGRNDISIDQYIKHKQLALAEEILGKKAVYLDIKYWIILCEASLKRSNLEQEYELLELAINLVENDLAFFPISESTFAELLKQEDPLTRLETAKLIDKFSTGVSLIPFEMRVGTEIARELHRHIEPEELNPLSMLVWTKVSNVLGEHIPTNTGFDEETELLIQKAFFDHLWNYSLYDMLNNIGRTNIPPIPNFESLADSLNMNNEKHSAELRSYEQTYLNEIAGAVDLYSGLASNIIYRMAQRRGIAAEYDIETGKKFMNFFREAYRKGSINKSVPTLDIHARCHAAVRWNKGRKLEANDIYDFHHASAALGHCSAFFTERSLCNLLTEKKIALDKVHKCAVVYKVKDSLTCLRGILR